MERIYKGRRIVVEAPGIKYGRPRWSVNGSDGRMIDGEYGKSVAETLENIKRLIDRVDAEPIAPNGYRWWHDLSTIETCPTSKTAGFRRYGSEHIVRKGDDCALDICVRYRRMLASKKHKRDTQVTTVGITNKVRHAGFTVAMRRSDGTRSSEGFSCGEEMAPSRIKRVAVLWHTEGGRVAIGPAEELVGELGGIAAFLHSEGYHVEIGDRNTHLRIYPKGTTGQQEPGDTVYVPAE